MTPTQKRLMDFIQKHAKENGVYPSYQEMTEGMNQKSKGSIYRMTNFLVERGYLEKTEGGARNLRIAKKYIDYKNKISTL